MMQNNHYKVSRHARVNFNLKVIYFLPQNKNHSYYTYVLQILKRITFMMLLFKNASIARIA